MHVLVYEWVVGGGPLDHLVPPLPELRREGLAMLRAVVDDLTRITGMQVSTIVDSETPLELPPPHRVERVENVATRDRALTQLAREARGVMLIAPEQRGALLRMAGDVERLGGRLLSPSVEFITVASDKHETALRLLANGVAAPEGIVMMPGERTPAGFPYPGVLKPFDGAGSLGVQRVEQVVSVPRDAGAYRLERFVAGVQASVAVVCGPAGLVPLAPCYQSLASDGSFAYEGGSTPIRQDLVERATGLARAAVRAMPPARGWVGIDMVLGEEADGSGDRVIEINPRMTTSYVGLRAAADGNLGEFVWRWALGEQVAPPSFVRPVRFYPDGKLEPWKESLAGAEGRE